MQTLYNLTQTEAKTLLDNFENDTQKLGLLFYNRYITKSIESGIKRANKLKKFVDSNL